MLLEQWSKGKLIARQPSLPAMLPPPCIVIDPSPAHRPAMVGSVLVERGAIGPGEETNGEGVREGRIGREREGREGE